MRMNLPRRKTQKMISMQPAKTKVSIYELLTLNKLKRTPYLIILSVLGQDLLLCCDQSHYLHIPETRNGD